ncbi:MAG: helix-turn-helix domain-containing protein [Lachnospiraceae bacterium]|nr:helix-turn-helix domain-containing protein [Lachnospiraceae bacterium]
MADISFIIDELEGHVLRKRVPVPIVHGIKGIVMVDGTQKFYPEYIYVADTDAYAHWLWENPPSEKVTLFTAGDCFLLDPLFKMKSFNIVSTDLSVFSLYNIVNRVIIKYREWRNSVVDDIVKGKSISEMIEAASERLNGYVILTNPGGKVMTSSVKGTFEDPLTQEIIDQGFTPYNTSLFFRAELKSCGKSYPDLMKGLFPDKGVTYYLKKIRIEGGTAAELLVTLHSADKAFDTEAAINGFGNVIGAILARSKEKYLIHNKAFTTLLQDLSDNKLESDAEVRNRFRLLTVPVEKYVYCVIADFEEDGVSDEYILHQLDSVFPNANIAKWNNQFVIMVSMPTHEYNLDRIMDVEAVNKVLKPLSGKAIVSYATSKYDKFRTIYRLTHRLLEIIKCLDVTSNYGNIYRYMDYMIYLDIDMMAKTYQMEMGHSDIIYMADHGIISLARYDAEHKSGLVDVLMNYLLNGSNVAKTAEVMYMHRNTVLNKINRINKIIEADLSDGMTQQRLLYSCQVVKYYKEVMANTLRI